MKSNDSPSAGLSKNSVLFVVQIAASLAVFALGLTVIIGWYSNNPTLIQVLPSFVPMQYNTALGFLLCGVALFLSLWKYRKVTFFLGLIIFALGSLTIAQYIFGFDLGIDQLFMRHYIDVKTSHPGRMAPNTAVCFMLSGIAFFVSNFKSRNSYFAASFIGAIITALGFVAFFGYLENIQTAYGWGSLTKMAVHTSLGFVIIGMTVIWQMWSKVISVEKKNAPFLLPSLTIVGGITISVCLWQALSAQENFNIVESAETQAQYLNNILKTRLDSRVLALERMAERWEIRNGTPRDEWEKDAERYISDYKSHKAIEWIDKDFIVRWVVPLKGNEKVVGMESAFDERRRTALERSRDTGISTMTQPLNLVQGGKGVLIYCPIGKGETFNGFILAVINLKTLFNDVIPDNFKEDYSFNVFDGDELIFQNGNEIQNSSSNQYIQPVSKNLEILNSKWNVKILPKTKTYNALSSSIDLVSLIIGIILSLLLAIAAYLFQKSRLDANEKTIANARLTDQITERQKIEKALNETSAFRQAVLDSANYMIVTTDTDGTILSFNKTAEELLGYTAEEVVGKVTPAIIHVEEEIVEYAKELAEEDGIEFAPGFETFISRAKRNRVDEREWTYVRKDGTTFPIILSVTTLRDENEEIVGYMGVGKDVTELKEATRKLKQSEETFKTFMNNSPAVAFIRDDRQCYRFINKTFEKRFKVTSDDLIGKTDFDWLDKERAERAQQTDKKIIRSGKLIQSIETVNKPDGSKDYWMLIKFPILNPDSSKYIGGLALDITESKRLEEELKEARDAALDSVKLKSEFLANMSHEIRTPMNGVLGMTEILLDTELDENQLDYAGTIQESAESLLTIINDILDFSKIEAGKIVFEKIDFDLRKPVENIMDLFAEQADQKGVEIASLVESDVPINLKGDPGRLKQILVNLVGNAVKFTKKGSVSLRVCKVSETDTNTTLQFDITDTGIGISPDAQKRLFQAFTQADGSMTRKYGGTGLGLAISRQLVELMDGEIDLESELGKGSKFTFTARFEKQIGSEINPIIPIQDIKGLRALIVDDIATNRDIISYQITSWGMIASEAENANMALKILRKAADSGNPFDLVFIDLMMPAIGGFELAQKIHKDLQLGNTKLILMPSFGKREHAKDALQVGIDGYLVKPIRQADLYDCIATVMGKTKSDDVQKTEPNKLVTEHTLSEKRWLNEVRILIAEDNLVNQKVTKSQLKNLGYEADIATTGLEVIEALEKQNYSLILMDCQMPEMDGYQATEEIRRNESDRQHIPIIAVTANALLGESDKCFAAGMDFYLAKPFKQRELKETVEKCLKMSANNHSEPISNVKNIENLSGSDDVAKDTKNLEQYEFLPEVSERLNELKEEVGEEMIDMIVSLFIEDSLMRIKKVHEFIEDERLDAIAMEAHSLKGSTANVGANKIADMCTDLESNAKTLGKTEIKSRFAEIESSFFKLFDAIEIFNQKETEKELVKT